MGLFFFIAGPLSVALGVISTGANDMLAYVDAADYFGSRRPAIEMKADKMIELAKTDPKTAKASVQQLLAIRWLGENKVAQAKDTLEQIAGGKLAQDSLGFAKDYAGAALAQLAGKAVPIKPVPANSLADGVGWFPDDVTFFGGGDLRGALDPAPIDVKEIRTLLLKLIQPRHREEVYGFIEQVGNIQIDRIVAGYAADPVDARKSKIFVRISGRADVKRLLDFIKQNEPDFTTRETKGPNGEPIIHAHHGTRPPVMAFIGNTEMVVCGFEGNDGDHASLVEQVLEIRAGKKPGLAKGPFGDTVKAVPPNASVFMIGLVPEEIRRELGRELAFLGGIPKSVSAHLIKGKALEVQFIGSFEDADEAKKFAEGAAMAKGLAVAFLNDPKPPLNLLKPEQLAVLKKALDSVKVEAKEATASGQITIPVEVLKIGWGLLTEQLPKAIE